MNRQETIQVLIEVNKRAPNYFKGMDSMQKKNVVNEWASAFINENFKIVFDSVEEFFKTNPKFAPFPSEIQKIIEKKKMEQLNEKQRRWYEHFPNSGKIIYNDNDVAWAEWEDWNNLPLELAKRMEYVPDPNDEERNRLLAIALDIQRKMSEDINASIEGAII